jgi:capsular polysaccharide transport system permease protein
LRIIDYTILGIVLFGGIYLLFTEEAIPAHLPYALGACVAIVALGFGWGMLNLVLGKKSPVWRFFFPFISRILMLFSGVFYVPDFLAPDTRYILSFNPMLHAIQLFKIGFYPQYPAILLDVQYLAYCGIFFLLLGLVVERVSRRFE